MHKVVSAKFIAPNIKHFKIEAPKIALKRKAGQFVIIRVDEVGERIPLTIADSDAENGTIDIIVQGVGKTTKELNSLESGDYIADVVGPLGKPSHIENFGTAVSIGGGVGTAIAYPTAVALK
jgi:ferredoxin--NADP+ reductase